jgi:hypothetical protein
MGKTIFAAEALRRKENGFCFQNSAPQRLCGEIDVVVAENLCV